MPRPENPHLASAFDSSIEEVPKLLESRMFRVTYPDGNQVHILGTTHVLPISDLSKLEILAIDGCSFFIGEEDGFDESRAAIIIEQQNRFLREEKDTWFHDLSPYFLEAITCLWREVIAPQFILGDEVDIRSFNRDAVEKYLSFCVYDLIERIPELHEKTVDTPDGMDMELAEYVFPERATFFDEYMERKLRNCATDNLPKDYLDVNRLNQDEKVIYCTLAAVELTSFTLPPGYDLSSISSGEFSNLEELRAYVIERFLELITSKGGKYTVSDILEEEEDEDEEDFLDMKKCNVKWTSQLHSMISRQTGLGLVGVGRGHLFGSYGMLTLLQREHGCTIEAASPSGWSLWRNMYMEYLDSYRLLRREILEGSATLPLYQLCQAGAGGSSAPIVVGEEFRELLLGGTSGSAAPRAKDGDDDGYGSAHELDTHEPEISVLAAPRML